VQAGALLLVGLSRPAFPALSRFRLGATPFRYLI
jgi:hypothetical protein